MKYTIRLHYVLLLSALLLGKVSFLQAQEKVITDIIDKLSFVPMQDQEKLWIARDSIGNKWLRGNIPPQLLGKSIVFQIPLSRIHQYELYLYKEGKLKSVTRNTDNGHTYFKSRFPQYKFVPQDSVYYLKLRDDLPRSLQISIQERNEFSSDESARLLRIGLYYGLALMSVVFNIVFYLLFRDRRFITYCVLLFTTFISFFYEDGMFHYLSDGQWTMDYLIIWNMSITAIVSLSFTYYFLGLEYILRPYIKWYLSASGLLLCIALVYTLTVIPLFFHIASVCCFFFAFASIYIAIKRFHKDVYARFLVLCFSLVVLTAIFYVLYMHVDSSTYSFFDISTFRLVHSIEIISISFAIIFKVRALQEENERYRNELNTYLRELDHLHNISSYKQNGHVTPSPFIRTKQEMAEELKEQYELTDRELDVLLCIWEGLSNKEIAEKLFISISTTKYHVGNLYLKLDVKNRNQVQVLGNTLRV